MPKLKLLILDAGIVIHLHELGIWDRLLAKCEVHLSKIVVEKEVLFQPGDEDKYGKDIDLSTAIENGTIKVFDVGVSDVRDFQQRFDPLYLGDLDDGEAESLAYMMQQSRDYLISSADHIVYKVLGNLGRGEQGISLEEILQKIGLGRVLKWPYNKAFREKNTIQGQQDSIRGRGNKK
ncbi:MAG: hypothetical protein JWN70_3635 [Planctomycetaceae bacterium]|nr:hypothetical protein [Planctomycetaceae bacterium]